MPPTNAPDHPPRHHIAALRSRLHLEGAAPEVTFDNGSIIRVERRIKVYGWLGPISVFHPDEANELERAYRMAVQGRYQSPREFTVSDDPDDDAPF